MDKGHLRRDTVRPLTGGDAAGRTAVLVATATVGSSFARGLMPRRVTDQAILTGVLGATEYGLVLASQSVAAAVVSGLYTRNPGDFAGIEALTVVTVGDA